MNVLDRFRIDGRIALVTGSSAGIGLAFARALAQAGATVVLNGRDAGRLGQAAAALRAEGHAVHEHAFDVTWRDDVDAAVAAIEAGIGPIDILVNNAGMQRRAPFPDFPAADWDALMRALKMLTKGMAIDLGPKGITVNGIGPGYFRTELNDALTRDVAFDAWLVGRTPSRRWGELDDLAGAVVFLASDAAAFVNGHILYVDGGVTASL